MKNRAICLIGLALFAATFCLAEWEIVSTPTTKALRNVDCVGYGNAYVVGDDRTLLFSSYYGTSWDTIATPDISDGLDINDLVFWDEYYGYISCDSGKIFLTTDGGISWLENSTPISNQHFYAIDFSPLEAGLAVGTSGWIVQGPDPSLNWFDWRIPTYSGRNIYDVLFPTDSLAYILAHRDFIRITATDSVRYEMYIDFSTAYLNGMCNVSGEPGWVYIVGDSGFVVSSFDSMSSYEVMYHFPNSDLNDIEFTYSDCAVICGDDGVIFESTDYGLSWDSIPSGTSRNLLDVDFWFDGNGLIVGRSGTILRTTEPLGIIENRNLPSAFTISAHPNPFNGAVTITAPEGAEIEIYDVNGRRISVIARRANARRGNLSDYEIAALPSVTRNDGVSEFVWQPAPTLPSSVYLVRARFGGCVVTRRLVYLK